MGQTHCFWIPTVFGNRGHVYTWGAKDRNATLQDVLDAVETGTCEMIFSSPQHIVEIKKDPKAMEMLSKLKFVFYGGGAVDKAVGDLIRTKVPLYSGMGATESGITGVQVDHGDDNEWEYFYFEPTVSSIEWQEQAPGVYESVHIRDPETEKYHSIWCTFPDLKEWHTKDLFTKHPSIPHYWKFEGRLDDLIIFAGGAKHNPMVYEETIRKNPLVAAALVAGTERQQPALLVELQSNVLKAKDDIMLDLLPTIAEANEDAPRHAVIMKTHVILATHGKPFERAAKGTVQRAPTMKQYQKELDEVYRREGDVRLDKVLNHIGGR